MTSRPSYTALPPIAGFVPRIALIVVLLPLPLWPRMPTISPSLTWRSHVEHDLLASPAGLQLLDREKRHPAVAVRATASPSCSVSCRSKVRLRQSGELVSSSIVPSAVMRPSSMK